jgi:hypothetical protein
MRDNGVQWRASSPLWCSAITASVDHGDARIRTRC